jgi:hypothetical protein
MYADMYSIAAFMNKKTGSYALNNQGTAENPEKDLAAPQDWEEADLRLDGKMVHVIFPPVHN